MRTKLTSLALAAIMTLAAAGMAYTDTVGGPLHAEAAYQQRFADVPEHHWAVTYIEEMAENGILSGYPDGNFYPDNKITRAEFAKIMTVAAGMNIDMSDTATIFEDVSADDWFAPYVKRAQYYLSGYTTIMVEGSTYRPNQLALREDITVAMVKLKGYSVDGVDGSTLQTLITDSNSVSNHAQKYVVVAIQRGLISGYEDGTFKGQSSITRAEAAAIMWRAFQYGNDNKLFDYNTPNPIASPTPTVIPTLTPTRRPTTRPTVRPTTRPTVRPASEEPLRPTQKPTPSPTAKPTATPEPTPSPEPERPYIIDTIFRGNIDLLTDGGDNNLYYRENDIIYSIGMDTETITEICDLSNFKMTEDGTITDGSIDDEMNYYSDFDVSGLLYDNENDRLFCTGEFTVFNDWRALNPESASKGIGVYEIVNGQLQYRFAHSRYSSLTCKMRNYLLFVNDNDYYSVPCAGYNIDTGEVEFSFSHSNRILDRWKSGHNKMYNFVNNDLYVLYIGGGANNEDITLLKYDFNAGYLKEIQHMEIWNNPQKYGYKDGSYYFWDILTGDIIKCDVSGKLTLLDINVKDDADVIDFKKIPSYFDKMFISDEGRILFYDNDSLRVLKAR